MSAPPGSRAAPGRTDGPTVRRLARRGVLAWLGVRCALAIVPLVSGAPPALPTPAGSGGVSDIPAAPLYALLSPKTWGIAAAAGGLLAVDTRATREATFLAHLGIGGRHVFALGAAAACLTEAICHLLIATGAAWL